MKSSGLRIGLGLGLGLRVRVRVRVRVRAESPQVVSVAAVKSGAREIQTLNLWHTRLTVWRLCLELAGYNRI